jgi:hypothetical protein
MQSLRETAKILAACAGVGLLIGIFYLGAAGGIWAAWAGGTASAVAFFLIARALRGNAGVLAMFVTFSLSAAIGGAAWWLVAQPPDTGFWTTVGWAALMIVVWLAVALTHDKMRGMGADDAA